MEEAKEYRDCKLGVLSKLHQFRGTDYEVTLFVFKDGELPKLYGKESVLKQYKADVVGFGGDIEFDRKMVISVSEWLNEMRKGGSSYDRDKLVNIKTTLLQFKEDKFKGVLTVEEALLKSKESYLEFLKLLDTRKTSDLAELAMRVELMASKFNVDAFFICASKGFETKYYTWPTYGLELIKLIQKYDETKSVPRVAKENQSPLQVSKSDLMRFMASIIEMVDAKLHELDG